MRTGPITKSRACSSGRNLALYLSYFLGAGYLQPAIQDSRLFGPNPWKILAPPSNYPSNNGFWATQPLEQILVAEFLLCELGVHNAAFVISQLLSVSLLLSTWLFRLVEYHQASQAVGDEECICMCICICICSSSSSSSSSNINCSCSSINPGKMFSRTKLHISQKCTSKGI